jgi:energy-coupling factor transport system substrate-specific component
VSWQGASLAILALAILGGFAWFERSRPSARVIAAVAALAALAVAGRVALAPIPNLVATTDVALLSGYVLGGGPGFAVGALAGLVSNFWLGQGPWTPWQMAGWGLVGIAGAALTRVRGREVGRLQLAVWAGLAGLAYGALLDLSVMVSYGGEQSLDRYLALSARGIPFNLVHATGNFMLMLAAGPALVRILDRYRDRSEHRWSDRPIGRAVACALLALCTAAPLFAPARSEARAGGAAALLWLGGSQNRNGGWGSEPGAESSVGMTGWAMLGLSAGGVNPRDIKPHGRDGVDFLRRHASEISSTGDLELTIIALVGAGVDPRSFADRDLVAALRDRRGRDGSFEKQVNLTAYGILALRAAKVDRSKLGKSSKWLRKAQNRNGGWGSTPAGSSEPDSTGAALQALAVAPGGNRESNSGLDWLRKSQHGTGGWALSRGAGSNTQSTAWAVQGIIAAGAKPGSFKEGGNSPYDFLKRRQRGDGHYAYSSGSDQTPVWVTAQGLTAAYGAAFPIGSVPRSPKDNDNDNDGNGGGSDTDSSTTNPDLGDYSPSGTDLGDLYDAGATGGTTTTTPEATTEDEVPPEATGPTVSGTDRERIAAGGTSAEPDESAEEFDAPATPVLLGGLGGLATLLGAGFIWFSRRLP